MGEFVRVARPSPQPRTHDCKVRGLYHSPLTSAGPANLAPQPPPLGYHKHCQPTLCRLFPFLPRAPHGR
eukprot:scaffold4131_cov83-Isochrysis_galbana.AAC.4